MKIKKAIITAAGFGTRFLPITKTIQKEMLPILSKPIIDYLVDDCVNAGIEEIIFVINERDNQIKDYYSENLYFWRYLERMNKIDRYSLIGDIHSKAKFSFIVQKESDPYGTSVPVLLSRDLVKDEEAFLVLMGDDYIYGHGKNNNIKDMVDVYERSGADGLLTCIEVNKSLVGKYGIAEYKIENGFKVLTDLVEKPKPEDVDSNFANISKYIFTPDIYKYIDTNELDKKTGELYITMACVKYAHDHKMVIYEPRGEYLDSGYVIGWLKANLVVAKDNPIIWEDLKVFLENLLK